MIKRILRWTVIVLAFAAVGFVLWALQAQGPSPVAVAATESGNGVTVELNNGWMVWKPEKTQPTAGLIFYPGGKVEFRSYAPLLRDIAASGYLAAVAPMPLNLAIFGIEKAGEVIPAYPQIKSWAVGGHSLGGSMAAQYAYNHPDLIKGLVLWGSYSPANLSGRGNLSVLSVSGSLDGLSTPDSINEHKKDLPASARFVVIEGGNHAQFGSYGEQPGDNKAIIAASDQWKLTVEATAALLKSIEGK
jgi:dienelactone hydrolase